MSRRGAALFAALAMLSNTRCLALDWSLASGIDGAMQLRDAEAIDLRAISQASAEQGWDDITLKAEGRFEADLVPSRTLPNGPEQQSRSSWNRKAEISDRANLDLRYLALDWDRDSRIIVGKQPLVWGTADGVQVLDVVTPRDYRSFVLEEPVDSRIPVWSARWIQTFGESFTSDAFVIVDPTVNVYPSRSGLYNFTSPALVPRTPEAGLPITLLAPGITDLPALSALVAPLLQTLPVPAGVEPRIAEPRIVTDRPAGSTIQGGARLQYEGQGFDLSTYYAYLRHRNPRYTLDAEYQVLANRIDPVVTLDFVRTHLLGLSGNANAGPYIVRGEFTYTSKAPLAALDYRDDGRSAIAPELAGLIAVDRMLPGNWFVSSQLYFKDPIDHAGDDYRNRTEQRAITALIRSDPFGRLPQLELFGFHSLLDHDTFLRGQITFRLRENLSWVIGSDLFSGDRAGVVGEYKDTDRVYSRLLWLIR
jgi:hypothetical protein